MYDKLTVETFLDNQLKLFPEKVAESYDEAQEFLEDVCATVCKNKKEVIEYLEDGMDIGGMTEEEILASEEVFPLKDGRYLIVEG
ncbi:MAG: glyoxalase [Pseudobutyrivibrio sp.]|uniref:glyoxalase n=1 Tax=Pseudobutyrivibrio sp. TaxID=2014367 RepID=UPI001B01A95D|nr:glyoxalase [Pseudobutyrivibrio sp.]MBO6282551.1 glyoxalase [Pseudobutyrivibrio sp.]MBP3262531.1 glyoxalase [Pseudobutyrivibrio sp.]